MTSLQVLILEYQVADLYSKKNGYLTRLADLKQLKAFAISDNYGPMAGKEEALWMIKNWPKLRRVYESQTLMEFRITLLKKR
ncbi:hypothetical protein BGX34_007960, partial [Mortierella sp. NVP85]